MYNRDNIDKFKMNQNDESKDLLDILLDENNTENIVLQDEDGNTVEFEQIAIIPYEEVIYCLLAPISGMKGVMQGEFIVCYPYEIEETDNIGLKVCVDEEIIYKLYQEYLKLLEEDN